MFFKQPPNDAEGEGINKNWCKDNVLTPVIEEIMMTDQQRVNEYWLNFEKDLLYKEYEPFFLKTKLDKKKFNYKTDGPAPRIKGKS